MIRNLKKHFAWFCTFVIGTLLFCNNNLMAHGWLAPEKESKIQNPVPRTQSSSDRGLETYAQFCVYCHGIDSKGLPASATKLKKHSPNLIERLKNHSEGDFHWKIKKGKGEMPSFREELSDNEIWNLINYIKSQE